MNAPAAKQAIELPPRAELLRLFSYDEATGVLTWRWRDEIPARVNKRFAGKPAGYANKRGYIQVGIEATLYLAHRIVWKILYGTEPPFIDHHDGNPSNNRRRNLRRATRFQNLANRGRIRGKALPKGVFPCRRSFHAKIGVNGKSIYLGAFTTPEAASAAYQAAARKHHGEFARSE